MYWHEMPRPRKSLIFEVRSHRYLKVLSFHHSLTDVLSVIRVLNPLFKPLITGKTSYQNSTALLIGLALKDCCPSLPVSILKAPAFFLF